MDIREAVVVVTGGASGIGEAVAKYLASAGAAVMIGDIATDGVARVVGEIQATGGRAAGMKVDVTQDAEVAALMEDTIRQFGAINIVIPCAGIIRDGLFLDLDRKTGKVKKVMNTDQFRSVIEVNLIGSFITLREAARRMVDNGWPGVLFIISSVNKVGQTGQLNYASSKAAVALWPRILCGEFQMKGIRRIRVVGVAPGYVGTPLIQGMNQDALTAILEDVHIGRLIQPEEVARAIEGAIINEAFDGTCLEITGGVTFGPRAIAK
jgi:3-oxoacyl-[acyl-carrier protein] reductase